MSRQWLQHVHNGNTIKSTNINLQAISISYQMYFESNGNDLDNLKSFLIMSPVACQHQRKSKNINWDLKYDENT